MFVPKEILQNLMMTFPGVRSWAQRHHETGIQDDDNQADRLVAKIERWAPLSGASVLEIGPGQTTLPCRAIFERGAGRVCAVDIEDYGCDWPPEIKFRRYDGTRLPFKDQQFDLVFSHDVFEHVRRPARLVRECHRVLAPGGRFFARIDVRSHYHGLGRLSASDLRYPWPLWVAMTWNRSAFTNRLRYSEWVDLFDRTGFSVEEVVACRTEILEEEYRRHAWLRKRSLEDVVITSLEIMAQRRLVRPHSDPPAG